MKIKRIILALFLLLLCMPYLQRRFKIVNEKPINGSFKPVEDPSLDSLNLVSWKSSRFQKDLAARVNEHLGFRPSLFRINSLRTF